MTGALALVGALLAAQIQTHPTGLKTVGLSHGRRGVRTVQILDKLYEQAGKPSLDLDFARYGDLHDNATGETSLVTFSRSAASSPGTYVAADGLIKTAAVNLALYSEEFDRPYPHYFAIRSSISANQIDSPDGKQTAEKITEDGSSANTHYLRKYGLSVVNATFSVYAKAGERTWLHLSNNSNTAGFPRAYFDLQNGVVGSTFSGAVATIQNAGNGWYRCSVYLPGTTNFADIQIAAGDNLVVYNGDGTSGLYLWGAQVEEGTVATPYIRTTSQALAAPRFDHDPVTGESLGLLVEEARSNLLPYSNDFSGWTPVVLGTGTAPVLTTGFDGPLGTGTATRFEADIGAGATSGDRSWIEVAGILPSGAQCTTIYAKSNNGLTQNVYFGPSSASLSATSIGLTWTRIQQCFSSVGSISAFRIGLIGTLGDKSADILISAAQAETGAFPTSYIPTAGTSLSRAADVAAVQNEDFATTNLLAYSESFDVGWGVTGLDPVTANAIAGPFGGGDADLLETTATSGAHYAAQAKTLSAGSHTYSVYVKPGTHDFVQLCFGSQTSYANFDLSNGTVGTTSGVTSAYIEPIAGGWYLVSLTYINSITSSVVVSLASSASDARLQSWAATGSENIYVWGASLTATEYPVAYTTTRNLLTDSQDFERGTWLKSRSFIDNDVAQAPDGTLTADKLREDTTAANTHYVRLSTAPKPAATYAYSVYLKAAGRNWALVTTYEVSGAASYAEAYFDLSTGTIGTITQGSAVIQDAGNGWYRCTVYGVTLGPAGNILADVWLAESDNDRVFDGDGTSGVLVWGAQLEPGSTATDYVRTVDVVGKDYRWFEPTEGTVYGIQSRAANTENSVFAMLYDGTIVNRSEMRAYRLNGARFVVETGSATQMDQTIGSPLNPIGSPNKHALSYKYNDSNAAVNGSSGTQDTSVIVPIVTQLRLRESTFGVQYNGHIKRLTYWPVRHPDATLGVITQ